jgi:arylsulfatase A
MAPNCSPSRAGLLTGRIPARCGIYNYINYGSPMHLPVSEVTIAKLLQQNGYATCVSGKWHLNGDIANMPEPSEYGFDHWFCTDLNAAPSHLNPTNFVRNGTPVGKSEGYSCQIVVDEAVRWLEKRDKDKPFFLYVPFHEPHTPLASPPELVARHKNLGQKRALYCANIENLDRAVGRLLDYLDANDCSQNTIVVFFSDNGSYMQESNHPLRGKKSNVWDGGIRVPGIIRWPGCIKAAGTCRQPVGSIDLFSTICEVVGITPPASVQSDGTSLVPLFNQKPLQRQMPLFWFFYRVQPAVGMREGDWSLVGYFEKPPVPYAHPLSSNRNMVHIKNGRIERFELYHYPDDISQAKNVAAAHPERFEAMKEKMLAILKSVVADGPDWQFKEKPQRKSKKKK